MLQVRQIGKVTLAVPLRSRQGLSRQLFQRSISSSSPHPEEPKATSPTSTLHTTKAQPTNTTMPSMGKFIVVFKDDVTKDQIQKYVQDLHANGGEVTNSYFDQGAIINGFAAGIPDSFMASHFTGNDLIAYIEPDGIVTTQG